MEIFSLNCCCICELLVAGIIAIILIVIVPEIFHYLCVVYATVFRICPVVFH